MTEKEIIGLSSGGISPYSLLNALISSAAVENSKLTKEQRMEREEKRRMNAEQRIREAKVLKNICPDCEERLSRGEKR